MDIIFWILFAIFGLLFGKNKMDEYREKDVARYLRECQEDYDDEHAYDFVPDLEIRQQLVRDAQNRRADARAKEDAKKGFFDV